MKYRNRIIQGHVLEVLPKLPEDVVDMICTSPPYWGLRVYGTEGQVWDGRLDCEHDFEMTTAEVISHQGEGSSTLSQAGSQTSGWMGKNLGGESEVGFCIHCGAWRGELGLEPTVDLYIDHLCQIFEAARHPLKKQGTLWVNLGDSYAGGGNINCGKSTAVKYGAMAQPIKSNLPAKCMVGVPFRFALAMISRGWILRNTIIWHKPNCLPCPHKDRFTINFEYIFFFSQQQKYYFEQQFEPFEPKSDARYRKQLREGKWYNTKDPYKDNTPYSSQKKDDYKKAIVKNPQRPMDRHKNIILGRAKLPGRNKRCVWKHIDFSFNDYLSILPSGPREAVLNWLKEFGSQEMGNVWRINTKPFPGAHFAVFPQRLIEVPIKAGCPEFVCRKCGKGRQTIYEKEGIPTYTEEGNPQGLNRSKMKWNESHPTNNPRWWSDFSNKGLSDCDCQAGFRPGIVLDPFMGAGTTAKVALKQNKHFIGIELKEEYRQMTLKRVKPYLTQQKMDRFLHKSPEDGHHER